MLEKFEKLLSENIYYSHESLSFYRTFYAGMGNDDVRELPSNLNTYLHSTLNFNMLYKKEAFTVGCVGRYSDENEQDENTFEFEGYFTNVVNVDDEIRALASASASANKVSLRLTKALLMASESHKNQRRKSDDSPYINHLIEVQNLLVTVAMVNDEDVIIAGLLHDIIEDSDVSKQQLTKQFGSRIANIVGDLTDDKSLPLERRHELAIEKLSTAPKSVKIVKLADVCSNAAAIPKDWDGERITKYFDWLDIIVSHCGDVAPKLTGCYKAAYLSLSD